jgi:hypothetical protein
MPTQNKHSQQEDDFARQVEGRSNGFLGEAWYFLRHNRRWWLTPVVIALLLFGVLVILAGSGAAPFIYTLF